MTAKKAVRESLPYIGISRMVLDGKSKEEIDKIVDAAIEKHKIMIADGYKPTLTGYIKR
jgi:hypothetical protein